jgi:predicted MFS family arabinose efflux permease
MRTCKFILFVLNDVPIMHSNINDDIYMQQFLIASPEKGNSPYRRAKVPAIRDVEPSSSEKFRLSISYLCAMGICGLILVAIASNLNVLAENCGTDFLSLGTVFIARGVGATIGTVLSAKLYAIYPGNETIAGALFLVVIMLIAIPSCRSLTLLHCYFFVCGLGSAITDTGCQIMTRKIQGKHAGPWLGANTVSFGLAGALVPVIELTNSDFYEQYLILAAVSLASVLSLWLGPDMEGYENFLREKLKGKSKGSQETIIPHYHVECIIAIMVFFLVGGKVAITAYLNDYIIETKVVEGMYANAVVLVLWVSIACGRLMGIIDQRTLTDESCQNHLMFLLSSAALSVCLIVSDYTSSVRLWAGIGLYGIVSGPCVGYCYDLLNRLTYASELSMSIVMFGTNVGASLVPFAVPLLWSSSSFGPKSLIIIVLLCSMIPIPLLLLATYFRYPKFFM